MRTKCEHTRLSSHPEAAAHDQILSDEGQSCEITQLLCRHSP